ncbi:hypothetical protein [Streptomyces sp. NPDC055134]
MKERTGIGQLASEHVSVARKSATDPRAPVRLWHPDGPRDGPHRFATALF